MECRSHSVPDISLQGNKRGVSAKKEADSFGKRIAISAGSNKQQAVSLETLQVNLGYRCNMSCNHCHIKAGPHRREAMTAENIDRVLNILDKNPIKALDLTGGAPELHPHFIYVVGLARAFQKKVIVRCNLTILFERGMEFLPLFYRDHQVELIASLLLKETGWNAMRGANVFDKSIDALHILNKNGYGKPGSGLSLHLVHNPNGAFLPPAQHSLEKRYKEILLKKHDIHFNRLFTFTNMPIGRFKDFLTCSGNFETYMTKLRGSFNPGALEGIMCRHMLNVGWDGTLYDCDLNQVAGFGIDLGNPSSLKNFNYAQLIKRPINFKEHCFGCTAGQGLT